MVGNRMFSFIDQRLQVNNSNQPYGDGSVIAFGDFFQLQTVMDNFVLQDLSKTVRRSDDYNVLGLNLWRCHFFMFELTKTMRQQDGIPFAELLNRLREGNQTPNDWQFLRTRIISSDSQNYPISAPHLFNAKVDSYNKFLFDVFI